MPDTKRERSLPDTVGRMDVDVDGRTDSLWATWHLGLAACEKFSVGATLLCV